MFLRLFPIEVVGEKKEARGGCAGCDGGGIGGVKGIGPLVERTGYAPDACRDVGVTFVGGCMRGIPPVDVRGNTGVVDG
jgi:hypothetical protein